VNGYPPEKESNIHNYREVPGFSLSATKAPSFRQKEQIDRDAGAFWVEIVLSDRNRGAGVDKEEQKGEPLRRGPWARFGKDKGHDRRLARGKKHTSRPKGKALARG